MQYEICCIGHTTMDRVINPGSTVHMPGGTSIYFSHAISGLPVRYALVTALAAADGPALERLQALGVSITAYPSAHTLFLKTSTAIIPMNGNRGCWNWLIILHPNSLPASTPRFTI